MEYTQAELMIILNDHQKWLAGTGGIRANLRYADLSDANLSGTDLRRADLRDADLRDADLRDANLRRADLRDADLRDANLSGADLRGAGLRSADLRGADLRGADLGDADLSDANLRGADLRGADLRGAGLRGADLSGTDLRRADLSDADLSDANLSSADLRCANLNGADLSGAEGILNPIEYLEKNFERTNEGIIVYKSFDENYTPNPNWKIEKNSIIEEVVNPLPTVNCGCGINVATKEWAKRRCNNNNQIWECLIRWEWLVGVVVPYQTEGQIRASKVQLIKPVNCL